MKRVILFSLILALFVGGTIVATPGTANADWLWGDNESLWVYGSCSPAQAGFNFYRTNWNVQYEAWWLNGSGRIDQGNLVADNMGHYVIRIPNPNARSFKSKGGVHLIISSPEDWGNRPARVNMVFKTGDNFCRQITAPTLVIKPKS